MTGDSNEGNMLSAAKAYIAVGLAVHWLRPRDKAPIEGQWQSAPKHTAETVTADFQRLSKEYRSAPNLGIRTGEPSKTPWGYLHLIDMDIRNATLRDEAWKVVLALWPAARAAPFVISGSGGESRHLYFFTDKPFRKLNLARSIGFTNVYDARKKREVRKYDWEIDLFGTGVQAVLPPSVHPDTGQPYTWGREIDFDMLDLGVGSIIPSDQVAAWGAYGDNDLDDDEDDGLMSVVRTQPMGLSEDEIDAVLADIPNDDLHHDDYVQVGMALHHEYEGSQLGFEKWCEWARHSTKFDIRTCKVKWRSFKGDKRPVRMATLIKIAGEARDRRLSESVWNEFDSGFVDELDDLLGGTGGGKSLVPITVASDSEAITGTLDDLLGDGPSITTPEPVFPEMPIDPEWETYFHRDEEGQVKPTLHNVELIVANDKRCRNTVALNEFTQEIVLIKEPTLRKANKRGAKKPIRQLDGPIWTPRDRVNGDLWSDSHDNAVRLLLEAPRTQGGYQLKVSDRDLRSAVDIVAQKLRFHPVRNYLKSLKWDGRPRVERLFIDYLGAPDDPYHRECALLFMLGAVTRVFEPGHKFDFVPILEGLQGKRKTTFIKILAVKWFAELKGDMHDTKQMIEIMQGAWILEMGELSVMKRAEQEDLKQFTSATDDKARLSYERRARVFFRQCVFMGSTNQKEYLDDPTGGRRWWPVKCTVSEIDTDKFRSEVHQYWAEAYAMYLEWRRNQPHEDLPLYLRNDVAAQQALAIQESRRKERTDDTYVGRIEHWLNQPIESGVGFDEDDVSEPKYREEVCLLDIWVDMMGKDMNVYPDRDQQLLARAMHRVEGWEAIGRRSTPNYGRQRVYRRVTDALS